MKIAHVLPALPDKVTGPRNSVTLLSGNINQYSSFTSEVFSCVGKSIFEFNGEKVNTLSELPVYNPDLVVFSGVYRSDYVAISRRLRAAGIPYIISPRGSLVRKSLLKSFYKKLPFLLFYGRNFIKGARSVHFLTEEERRNSFSYKGHSFVSGNCVNFNADIQGGDERKMLMGFLGRYDINHKGLDLLMSAIFEARFSIRERGWKAIFCGPDFQGGKAWLLREIERREIEDIVTIMPPVHGEDKFKFLNDISIFLHTSRYEGQPQAVMEAMSCGAVPLVVPGTNMSKMLEDGRVGYCLRSKERISELLIRAMISHENGVIPSSAVRSYASEYFSPQNQVETFLGGIRDLL